MNREDIAEAAGFLLGGTLLFALLLEGFLLPLAISAQLQDPQVQGIIAKILPFEIHLLGYILLGLVSTGFVGMVGLVLDHLRTKVISGKSEGRSD